MAYPLGDGLDGAKPGVTVNGVREKRQEKYRTYLAKCNVEVNGTWKHMVLRLRPKWDQDRS